MSTPQQNPSDIPTSQPPSADGIDATAPPPYYAWQDGWAPTTAPPPPPYVSTTAVEVPPTWAVDHPAFNGASPPQYHAPEGPVPTAFVQGGAQYSPHGATSQGAPQEELDYLSRRDHEALRLRGRLPENQQSYAGYLLRGTGLTSTQITQIGGLTTEETREIRQALNPAPPASRGGPTGGSRDRRMHQGGGRQRTQRRR